MKKIWTYVITLVVVIGLINTLSTSVRAEETCSITVNTFDAEDTSLPIPGVQVTLYHIANLSSTYTPRYISTPDFAGFTGNLTWATSSDCMELAKQLSSYAENQNIKGITQTTSTKGAAIFEQLEKGLYLVVQTGKEVKNYKTFMPSLVEVPMYQNDSYIYQVNLYPKIDSDQIPTPTPTIPIPDPDTPGDLPSTGMLQWPIPVLAVMGCSCLLIGVTILLRSHKKGESNEK